MKKIKQKYSFDKMIISRFQSISSSYYSLIGQIDGYIYQIKNEYERMYRKAKLNPIEAADASLLIKKLKNIRHEIDLSFDGFPHLNYEIEKIFFQKDNGKKC